MTRHYIHQFDFQHTHATGAILNVGCDSDSSKFRARGATNVDIWTYNPFTKQHLPVDIVADARALPASLHGRFDTVILGDILEHFVNDDDPVRALQEAAKCLATGGRVIITCPDDPRTPEESGLVEPYPMYATDIRAYHAFRVSPDLLRQWCERAGLIPVSVEHIAYPFVPDTGGWGCVAVVPEEKPAEAVR